MKSIYRIYLSLLFIFSCVCSFWYTYEFLYFTWNWNDRAWFQQWCLESYNVYYNSALYSYKWVNLSLDVDDRFIYSWKAWNVNDAKDKFFVINTSINSATVFAWSPERNQNHWFLGVKNDTWLQIWNYSLWSFNFIPWYSENNYTWNFVFKLRWDENDYTDSIALLISNQNKISKWYQELNYMTWSFLVKREPCKVDTKKPTITSNTYTNNSTWVSNVWLSFIIDDKTKNWETPYYYSGEVWTWNWGENKIWTWTINDQTGVDFSTVVVKVQWNGTWKTFTGNVNLNWTSLWQTWWWTDRWYNVNISSSQLFDFGIEEQINITIDWKDRNWSGADTYTRVFNIPTPPTIENLYPANWAETVQINSEIRFSWRDDWAGVSGDYVNITIECLSWCYDRDNTKIYTKSFFDENEDSSITLVWTDWLWNAWWYDYILKPDVDLPAESNMKITVDIYDLKGNQISSDSNSWTFDTRPLCSKLQCCSTTTIMTWWETWIEFTWSVLTITGWNSIVAWIETWYEYSETLSWDLFVINCNYVWTTLFKWNPEDLDAVNLWVYTDEIIFSWDDTIYWVLSGNVLTFYKIPSWSVELSNLRPNTGAPKSDFDFEWTASLWEGTNVSWYKVQLYTWDNCDNNAVWTEIWSGYMEWTWWDFSMWYTGDALTSLQQYCWKVSAMKGNRAITWSTATFTGMMEIIVKAHMWMSNNDNTTKWVLLMYAHDNHNTPLYSWVLWLWKWTELWWTWVFNGLIESWCYDVVFKSWNHLASYILWACTSDWTFDFTHSSWLYNDTIAQVVWDLPAIGVVDGHEVFNTQDNAVNLNDYSAIFSELCWKWNVTQWNYHKVCDLDWNNRITSFDTVPIINRLQLSEEWLFDWFDWMDYYDIWVVE